jgi:hypothetical protein
VKAAPPKPPWTRDAHVEDARREIVERFAVEELAYRVIDAAEGTTPTSPLLTY